MARLGKLPMRGDGWNADYPDAENFMQLLYGPNAGQENQAQFKLPAFDQLYDEARKLPDSPARTQLFNRMTELVVAYAPWRLGYHLIEDQLLQPWVRDHKPHPIRSQVYQFIDVNLAARPK
jgi:ABC-type oligopeptide transport system substrate-binding subunit